MIRRSPFCYRWLRTWLEYRAVIVCALLVLAMPARAANVLVVLSSSADPYQKAAAALKETLGAAGLSMSSILLNDLAAKGIGDDGTKAAAVVGVGTEAAIWLHEHLPADVPLTYCLVGDPEGSGLTQGRAADGVSTMVPLSEQFGLIQQALPKARTMGILYRSNEEHDKRLLEQVKGALPDGWRLKAVAVNEHEAVAAAIEALFNQDVDAIWTFPETALYNTATVRALLLASVRRKVPVFGFSAQFVRAGALVGVGINPASQGEQAAAIVLQQVQDTAAPTHPAPRARRVPQPPLYQIAVNLIATEALGVELPGALIERATVIFRKETAR